LSGKRDNMSSGGATKASASGKVRSWSTLTSVREGALRNAKKLAVNYRRRLLWLKPEQTTVINIDYSVYASWVAR